MKQIIQSVKHILQHPALTAAQGTVNNIVIAKAVKDYTGVANEVPVGAAVKAVYIEMWILGDAQQFGNVVVAFEKLTNDAAFMSAAQSTSLDSYPNKKNILYTTQGLTPGADSNPVPFMRAWYKVPKGKQRIALGDTLVLNIGAIVNAIEGCGLTIYKHYT